MKDHSSGHITSEEGRELISAISAELKSDHVRFIRGELPASYGMEQRQCEDPLHTSHDILDRPIADYLPSGDGSKLLNELMVRSVKILASHPVNEKRRSAGKRPASSIWLWGQGRSLHSRHIATNTESPAH